MAVVMKDTATLLDERRIKAAQIFIDNEVLRRCDAMVPMDTGMLVGSGIRATEPGSGEVVYSTVYARRWYYIPANFSGAPMRGNYWFERMKGNGGRAAILRGAAKITGGRSI